MPSPNDTTSETSWVRVDLNDTNPSIQGNTVGLQILRDKIDEAINSQYSLMGDFDCNFNQIRLTDEYPLEKKEGATTKLLFYLIAVLLILGILTLLFLLTLMFSS